MTPPNLYRHTLHKQEFDERKAIDNRKLEDLLNAIATYNGSRDPLHPAYRARNLLCLQEFVQGENGTEMIATDRLRKFDSLHSGMVACLFDLKIKCSGRSRARLRGETFNLRGLARAYYLPDGCARYLVKFVRKSLSDQSISEDTPLDYFLSDADKITFRESIERARGQSARADAKEATACQA